jgi:hypothetical protein
MSFAQRAPILFVLSALPLLALGCGKDKGGGDPETTRHNAVLAEIHDMYAQHIKSNQRPPKQLSDLQPYQGNAPVGFKALQDRQYEVVWGVSSKDAQTVLAYEKDARKQGGAVLMADGTVKKMTADELEAALKSKG